MSTRRKGGRKPKPTHTTEQVELITKISTEQILKAGANVLGVEFGFTDAQQARWIELTARDAVVNIKDFSETMRGINERLEHVG